MNSKVFSPNAGLFQALPAKGSLCRIGYSRGTIHDFHGAICAFLRGNRSQTITIGYVNPHVFNLAMHSETLRAFLEKADIVAVDGIGISIALWFLRGERQARTVMTHLFDRVLETPDLPALRAAVIGGSPGASRKASEAITRASRKIEMAAYIDGYQPIERYLAFITEHQNVDLIFVAMGSPRSEEFILQAAPLCQRKILWHIGGGTLNFYAGELPRVPRIVSKLWLQWFWRIVCEPKIAPRYVIGIPAFARKLFHAWRQEQKTKGICIC
jgi:exopolysaccharide biosynthesis WecB/TagA/CpsF family protein